QEVYGKNADLPAAFDNVARVNEHGLGSRILDLQLVDAAGLTHLDLALGNRLLQSERHRSGDTCTVHEIDRQVVVHKGTRDAHALISTRGSASSTGHCKRHC